MQIRRNPRKEAEIRKKLQSCGLRKPQDYQQIIDNLMGQKQKLEADLTVLRTKVTALKQKQARKVKQVKGDKRPIRTASQKQTGKNRQHQSLPKHLNVSKKIDYDRQLIRRYGELRRLQRLASKGNNKSKVQAQYRNYLNQLLAIDYEMQEALRHLHDEQDTHEKLTKALKGLEKEERDNFAGHMLVQRQNKLLRRRIHSIKRMVDRQIGKQIQLHNGMIDVRERERVVQKREKLLDRDSRQDEQTGRLKKWKTQEHEIELSPQQSSRSSESSVQIDWRQITSGDEVYQIEGQLNRWLKKLNSKIQQAQTKLERGYPSHVLLKSRECSKLTFEKQFSITITKCNRSTVVVTDLFQKKVDLLMEMLAEPSPRYVKVNEAIANQTYRGPKGLFGVSTKQKTQPVERQQNVEREEEKIQQGVLYPRTFTETDTMTDEYQDFLPLRRQFVGQLGENITNDRSWLRDDKETSIRTVHIYYSQRGIATVRMQYALHHLKEQNRVKSSKLAMPESFVGHFCKIHTVSCGAEDFFKYFKVRYRPRQNRVTNIRVVSNRGVKGGWGEPKREEGSEEEKQLVFDIDEDEYPVCSFACHFQRGPYWYLSAFGVEINQL